MRPVHPIPIAASPVVEGNFDLPVRQLLERPKQIHVETGLSTFVDHAGHQQNVSIRQRHSQRPAVRSDLDGLNLLPLQLANGFGDPAEILDRGDGHGRSGSQERY